MLLYVLELITAILFSLAGASIPWGNEAEIFIIAILGRKKFYEYMIHRHSFFASQEEKKCFYDESSMYVKCFLSPLERLFHVLKITSYPPSHRKAKFSCNKNYFFPRGKAKFHVRKLVLPPPPGKAKFHVLKLISYPWKGYVSCTK